MNKSAIAPMLLFFLIALLAIWGGSLLHDAQQQVQAEEVDLLNPLIPVRLMKHRNAREVPLELIGNFKVTADDGEVLLEQSQFRGSLRFDPRGVLLGSWLVQEPVFRIQTEGDAGLLVGGLSYRGRLRVELKTDDREVPTGLELKLELPLEDYVLGVVCGEMPTSMRNAGAALRAQAIAARTYALWRLGPGGRSSLRDDAGDQRFFGVDFQTEEGARATEATRGQILTWAGELLPAYYHADCGGHTGNAHALRFVSYPVAALEGVADPICEERQFWRENVSAQKLDRYAKQLDLGHWLRRIAADSLDEGGRWLTARLDGEFGSKRVRGTDLAATFGLPSTMVKGVSARTDGGIEVFGRGRGHGVGMCQMGALRRARDGEADSEILQHYYPGTEVQALNGQFRAAL